MPAGPYTVRLSIVNLLFTGVLTSRTGASYSRDHFKARLGSRTILVRHVPDYDQRKNSLRRFGGYEVTATIDFPLEEIAGLKSARRFAEDVCYLLSFATGRRVNRICLEVLSGGSPIIAEHVDSLIYDYSAGLQVIPDDIFPTPSLPAFLEACYANYRIWRSRLKIHVALEYTLKAKHEPVAEFQFLLAGTAMESLKENFRRWQHLPVTKPGTRRRWWFKELLVLLYGHFGMRNRSFPFIELRNRVVHSGTLRGGHRGSSRPHYLRLATLSDRLLLQMLGYRGTYFDHARGRELRFRP